MKIWEKTDAIQIVNGVTIKFVVLYCKTISVVFHGPGRFCGKHMGTISIFKDNIKSERNIDSKP